MSLRELFRQKLENAEIIPEPSLRSKLMRKQAGREFVRFNPGRFNIYYLGVILVAGISAALILHSGPNSSTQLSPLTVTSEISKPDSTENLNIPEEQTVTQKSVTKNKKTSGVSQNMPIVKSKIVPLKETVNFTEFHKEKSLSDGGGVNDSITKKGLFSASMPGKNTLRGGNKSIDAVFESSASEGCAPLKLSFKIKSGNVDSCRWSFGDGGYSDEKNPDWIFDVEGEYKVVLNVFGSNGLQATSSAVITIYPKPKARFEIEPDKAVLPKDEIRFSNYSINATKFNWDFGDESNSDLFEPRHVYSKFGNYTVRLVVTSDYGCADSLIVRNAFSGSEYFINFPNAFIPSTLGPTGGYYSAKSDEAEQVFHPVYSGVSDYQLKIFSKKGFLIYESSDTNLGWDGYYNSRICEPGVYIWKVRGNFRNGEPFIKMGDVTLLRN